MKLRNEILKALSDLHKNPKYAARVIEQGDDGMAVAVNQDEEFANCDFHIIASWGLGWDHVSVSLEHRCPTWEEMCWVKGIFWHEHESVIQYHPAKDEYVNCHKFCLHLWKPQNCVLPAPPPEFVGIKT